MSFYKKYELQRLAHEGEAKVFRATQNATGKQVLLHVLPSPTRRATWPPR